MAHISFETRQQTARFHNPLRNGEWDEQTIEVRLDPLTGHQSTFNSGLEGKTSVLFPDTDSPYLLTRADETQGQCFLCDGKWRETTPRYGENLISGGRITRGDVVLFPNLFPLAGYHAVVMLGSRHFRTLDDFPPLLLEDAFGAALEFIRRCYEEDPKAEYFTINANYLFPAGASVLHPHLQILGSPHPGTHHRLLLEKSREYYRAEGSCYWTDLVQAEESSGQRFIGRVGASAWLTAFSPIGANEINAIWTGRSDFLEWGEEDVRGMAEGLSRVLRSYHEMHYSTFNLSCFSGPLNAGSQEFRCMLRVINRQNVVPHYRTDDFYFQKLLKNEIIITRPEQLAKRVRKYFQTTS